MADKKKCGSDKWSINETLLQSYRSIFISSQTFLLTVGAIVSSKSHAVLYVVSVIGLIMIWGIWFRTVRARHLIVDYHKYGSELPAPEQAKLCTAEEYVKNIELRNKANVLFGLKTNWRETRINLDLLMPLLLSCVWVVLIIFESGLSGKGF